MLHFKKLYDSSDGLLLGFFFMY